MKSHLFYRGSNFIFIYGTIINFTQDVARADGTSSIGRDLDWDPSIT